MNDVVRFRAVMPTAGIRNWPGPLDMRLHEGGFHVIVTTPALTGELLRLCIGLRRPSGGRVEVLGKEPATLGRRDLRQFRRELGVGFRPGGLLSNLTLQMNLVVPLLYSGDATLDVAIRRADDTLDECGLKQWAAFRPADLPPDVAQLGVIARAIAREPSLLLLEDPISSLRSSQIAWILAYCRRKAGSVLLALPERDATVAAMADTTAIWDEHGLQLTTLDPESHEVGTG